MDYYHDDNGFSENDKHSYITKNGPAATETCGMNGMGIKLALSRIIEPGMYATTRSLNDRTKCRIYKNYEYVDWHDFDNEEDEDIYREYERKGSHTTVPITEDWYNKLNTEECKKTAMKFHSILIDENKCRIFWNGDELPNARIIDFDNAIEINYTLGYDTKKKVSQKHLLLI